MAKYAGDQVANSPEVVANYARTRPSSRFSTRQLQFVRISLSGVSTTPYAPNSVYSKAVRGIQTVAEIQMVGEPYDNVFVVLVAYDTLNNGNGTQIGVEQGNLLNSSGYTHGPNDQTDLSNNNYNQYVGGALQNNPLAQSISHAINAATGLSCDADVKFFQGDSLRNGTQMYSDESIWQDC